MDVLDDILDTLNLKGTLYFRTDFCKPWAVTVPHYEEAARFHLVVQGICHVGLAGGQWLQLGPGDLILIPRGANHILSDQPVTKAPPLETVLKDAAYNGSGVLAVGSGDDRASTQMVCGHFSFRSGANHQILRALPDYMIASASDRAKNPLLDETLRLIVRRIFCDAPGSSAAVTRLSEIVFIELLRSAIHDNSQVNATLKAFSDPRIGRSLQLIHARPEEHWTVERLASEVAMSRSRFSDRFRQLLETSPMSYLADWRLQKALALLDDTRISVQQVASQIGYQSPAAFSRAFCGKFGVAPKDYRKNAA
ncbi:MAG: AraC family transcriptional regulator [Porticoccaceae bacterium]|nr:AraC family transcriptional regulator [Porticoccaceae bacterium]